jgi:hypothetical protein
VRGARLAQECSAIQQKADPCLRQAGLSTSRACPVPRLRDGKEKARDYVRDDNSFSCSFNVVSLVVATWIAH